MRRAILAAAMALCPIAVRADEPPEVKAVLDKAIAAVGGADKLAQLKAGVWTTRAAGRQSETKLYGQLPGQFRLESERVVDGKPITVVRVIDGKSGWVKDADGVRPMSAEQVAGMKATYYHKAAAQVLLPLREPGTTLTPLGESTINDRPVVGVRVLRKDVPEMKLFFDKETGLVVKSEARVRERPNTNEAVVEDFYSDYREINLGVKLPFKTKTVRDGRPVRETEMTGFRAAPKLDEGLFKTPK
jgi:hypothetical protein